VGTGKKTGKLKGFRNIHDESAVHLPVDPPLKEEGNFINDNRFITKAFLLPVKRLPDPRVNDPLEPGEAHGIRKDDSSQSRPIDLSLSDRPGKGPGDLAKPFASRRNRLPSQDIGIDHRDPPAGNQTADIGLSRSNPSGKPQKDHPATPDAPSFERLSFSK
jgi:hypothetical protein